MLAELGANPDVEHMLALSLHAQQRSEESLQWFESASRVRGGALLWNNYAAALLAVGDGPKAIAYARRATQSKPDLVGAWLNLGLALEVSRQVADAVGVFQKVLTLSPSQRVARRALARCHLLQGNAEAALSVLESIAPGKDSAADLIRCEAWIFARQPEAAAMLLERLCQDRQVAMRAKLLKAKMELESGRSNRALATLASVLRMEPENRAARVRSALIHLNRGDSELGLSQLRSWLDEHPEDQGTASSYLVACNYSEDYEPRRLLAEHVRLQPPPLHVDAWPARWSPPTAKAPIRVGWVSSAFNVGPVEIFFSGVLRSLLNGNDGFEHRLYAIGGESTAAPAASWARGQVDLSNRNDLQLVEALRAEGNDIVVDMVGRAAGSRLAVFAARVAPVQVSWLDAFYPSGIAQMDYLISDSHLSPPGSERHFGEELLRLPHGRLAYRPPPVGETSLAGVESRRLVSLNRFSKLNDAVVDVWSRILRELPDWTLLLKARGGGDRDFHDILIGKFARHGVPEERIEIVDAGPYAEAMATYETAAIALDPFPFSGCSTSCDALWMGLPVVTWPRETIASRQTAAWLEFAGLSDWVARDADSYVQIAVELARDVESRRIWRQRARDCVRSALCDADRLAGELVDAFRRISPRP